MNSNQIATDIIHTIIDTIIASHTVQSADTNTPFKQTPIVDDEAFLKRYQGGTNGSYMKNKLQLYQIEAYKSFKSDKLNLITHLSSIEKFVLSCKKPEPQTEQVKDKDVIKIDNEFMTSSKKHKPKIMEEKEKFEAAKKLILSEKPIKRKHYDIENQNSNPNIVNLDNIISVKGGYKMEPIMESSVSEENENICKKSKYIPPKHPKKIDISAIKSKVNTNLRI